MSESITQAEVVAVDATGEIQRHRKWFMLAGALFLVTGIGAIVFPMAAGFAINVVVGVALLVSGAMALAYTALVRAWASAGLSLVGGLVDLIAGGLMLMFPVAGVSALALLLVFWFLVAGAMRISIGWQQRPDNGWLAFITAGVLSVLLGLFILIGWPAVSAIALGVMVGVHFLFGGFSLLAMTRPAGQAGSSARSAG